MSSSDCIFCNPEPASTFHREPLAFAFWDAFPVTSLHALVIPRRHVETVFDLTADELDACIRLVQVVRSTILEQDATVSGFNVGTNAGTSAGQTVLHAHIHVIPRRDGDVPSPRGGVRHVIPGKGSY